MSAAILLGGVAFIVTEPPARAGVDVTLATPTDETPRPRTFATVGDSFTDPAFTGPSGWPLLVAAEVGASVTNLGVGGAGYVRPSDSGVTFPLEVTRLDSSVGVVVVWGGFNDRLLTPVDVEAAARATFASIARITPRAELVVIGPQWPNGEPDGAILGMRDAVRSAAATAGVTFVDPIAEGWFAGHPEAIGSDGVHPNQGSGQQLIAEHVAPYIATALAR